MSLEIVKPRAPSTFDPSEISPDLADSTVHYHVRPEDGVHQFDFGVEFDGQELAGSLALNTSVVFGENYKDLSELRTLDAVRSGLKTLTYPNSRIMRHAKHVDREARHNLREARSDITGLITAINHPEHHRMVPATLALYGELTANMETEEALKGLKPKALKELCEEYGVSLNELALHKLKGRKRDTRVSASDYVNDAETLKELYRLKRFKRVTVLPDEGEEMFTGADDWPKDSWAEKADKIQLLHMLSETQDDSLGLGVRWNTLIRDDTSPRHVVKPRLLVRSYAEERIKEVNKNPRAFHGFVRPWTTLVFESQPPEYDRTTHTVVHTSPVLGAVLLMQGVEPEKLSVTLRKALFGKNYRHWKTGPIPDKALGLSPMVAQDMSVQHSMLTSTVFKRLLTHADAQLQL